MNKEYYIQETDNWFISWIPSKIAHNFGFFYTIFNKNSKSHWQSNLVKINCPYCRGDTNNDHSVGCPLIN